MQRYHPAHVALHWLMALVILLALVAGTLLANLPPESPDKVLGLAGHMTVGIAIGVLLLIRLAVRLSTSHPPDASTGNALLDRVGRWTHWAFYLFVAGMVLSGLGMAFGADLFSIVYGGAAETLPPKLQELPPRIGHGIISKALIALIALHVAAAFYHQIILKDRLLGRMWFGRRTNNPK